MDHFMIEQHQTAFVNEYVLGTIVAVDEGDAEVQRFAYEGTQKRRGGGGLLRGVAVIGFQTQRFEERPIAEYLREVSAPICSAMNGREQGSELADMIGANSPGEQHGLPILVRLRNGPHGQQVPFAIFKQ